MSEKHEPPDPNDCCPACGRTVLFAAVVGTTFAGTVAKYPCPHCGVRLKDNALAASNAPVELDPDFANVGC